MDLLRGRIGVNDAPSSLSTRVSVLPRNSSAIERYFIQPFSFAENDLLRRKIVNLFSAFPPRSNFSLSLSPNLSPKTFAFSARIIFQFCLNIEQLCTRARVIVYYIIRHYHTAYADPIRLSNTPVMKKLCIVLYHVIYNQRLRYIKVHPASYDCT